MSDKEFNSILGTASKSVLHHVLQQHSIKRNVVNVEVRCTSDVCTSVCLVFAGLMNSLLCPSGCRHVSGAPVREVAFEEHVYTAPLCGADFG